MTPTKSENGSNAERSGTKSGNRPSVNYASTTLRSFGQFMDLQAATTRIMWRAQAKAAASCGMTDYSHLFQSSDERGQHLFSAATENLTQMLQQVDAPVAEVTSQFTQMLEQRSINLSERWKQSLEEIKQQTSESMKEIKELSLQQAEELARTSDSLTEATRATLREGGEQFRETVRQGREIAVHQAETVRKETEKAADEMEDKVQEGGKSAQRDHARGTNGAKNHHAR